VEQGNWDDARPARVRRGDGDAADRSEVVSILRRQAHHDRKIAVTTLFVKVTRGLAAYGCLDGGVDVARRETVARGTRPVDVDPHRGLAERLQHREVGNTWHRLHHALDLLGGLRQRFEIVAVELYRVLALDTGCRLFDVILDVLGEVEIDPRKLLLQGPGHLFGQLVLVHAAR